MKFAKYQALGNDYLLIESSELVGKITPQLIQLLCDRHYGIGADGILIGSCSRIPDEFVLQIFNPDGSEAEKSGNGLRIFGRYLFDNGLVKENTFRVSTKGGPAFLSVRDGGNSVEVFMGKASFQRQDIPVLESAQGYRDEILEVEGKEFQYNVVSLGNPHCVIILDDVVLEDVLYYGPLIERHNIFPNRINVQFVKVLSPSSIKIEIWERGAGYTLASGSSACAAGLIAYRLGKCLPSITVFMPGGPLSVVITDNDEVTQKGPASPVFHGVWSSL